MFESSPDFCPRGHGLGPNRVLVGWVACLRTPMLGHRTHECLACGAIIHTPPIAETCDHPTTRPSFIR